MTDAGRSCGSCGYPITDDEARECPLCGVAISPMRRYEAPSRVPASAEWVRTITEPIPVAPPAPGPEADDGMPDPERTVRNPMPGPPVRGEVHTDPIQLWQQISDWAPPPAPSAVPPAPVPGMPVPPSDPSLPTQAAATVAWPGQGWPEADRPFPPADPGPGAPGRQGGPDWQGGPGGPDGQGVPDDVRPFPVPGHPQPFGATVPSGPDRDSWLRPGAPPATGWSEPAPDRPLWSEPQLAPEHPQDTRRRVPVMAVVAVAALVLAAVVTGVVLGLQPTGNGSAPVANPTLLTETSEPVQTAAVTRTAASVDESSALDPTAEASPVVTATATGGVGTGRPTPSGPVAAGSAVSGVVSPGPTDPKAAAAFVASVDALIDRSEAARGIVGRTATGLDACRIKPDVAVAEFTKAAKLRAGLVSDAAAVPAAQTAAVGPGAAVVAAFQQVQQLSQKADEAFAAWAQDIASRSCGPTAVHTVNWTAGNDLSAQATAAKRKFIAVWNPVASAQGSHPRSEGQI